MTCGKTQRTLQLAQNTKKENKKKGRVSGIRMLPNLNAIRCNAEMIDAAAVM